MAGPKQSSSSSAKKPRAKADKPAKATYSALSAEFVVDSDDSVDAHTPRVQRPVSKKTKTKPSSTKPTATTASIPPAKLPKKRKSPSPSHAKDGSSASESENGSISQDENSHSKKRILPAQDGSPTPKPKLATARPNLKKPSINVKPFGQKNDHGTGSTPNKSVFEVRESSEDDSSESESGSGTESAPGSSDKTSLPSPRKKSPVQKIVSQQPAPSYTPPTGFESTSISLHPASTISEILSPSNLQGKQIWHITAPELVPISLVKEVSTQNIGSGASILDYRGAKYGLVPESEGEQGSSGAALLLPSAQTNDYRPSKTNIIKTLHLQQLVSLPSHGVEPAIHPNHSASSTEPYRKTPRQQPEGLRMRYRPFGVSDDSDRDSSSEPLSKAPEFRTPAVLEESSHGRKRKRPKSDDDDSNTFSVVKPKKRKKSPQATPGAIENPIDIDAISDKRSTGAESPIRSLQKVNGVHFNGGLPKSNETKEERRQRREKKRLEKRESQTKPATALPLDVKQDAETMQPGEVVEGALAFASAVEGTTSTNGIPPQKESNEEKAKRRKEKRKRKDMKKRTDKGASSIFAEDKSQHEVVNSQDEMMQEIEKAQRDASIPIPIPPPKNASAEKPPRSAQEPKSSATIPNQISHRKETKEEKKRRRMERGSA